MKERRTRESPYVDELARLPDLHRGDAHDGVERLRSFLRRFGHLSDESVGVGDVVDDAVVEGLRRYQHFYGLSETGDLDAYTREHMSMPRCGMPDPSSTAMATVGAWTRRSISYGFGTMTSDTVGATAAKAAVRRAFDTWQAAGVGLIFREVSANPDIEIEWRNANDPDNNMVGGTLAHADFPPGFSIHTLTLPLPLHFDDSEHTWVDGASGGYDIESIALHEIGHCLGLLHTGVAGSVMLPTVSANATHRTLGADDLAAVRSLYPPRGSLHAAASWGPNRYDVFGLSEAGNVLQLWYDGTWHRTDLGNGFGGDRFVGQLSAASWGAGRLDVFGLGQSGNVLQLWYDGRWHWSDLGNGFAGTRFFGPLTATSWGPNRYDVFGFDGDGKVLQLWWDGSRWNWSNLGNHWGVGDLLVGRLAAASWSHNRIDVFSLQRNGNVLQLWWDGGRWNWSNLGNGFSGTRFAGPVTAASWGPGRLDVFGQGVGGEVLQLWYNGAWNWANLGNGFAGDRFVGLLAAASWGRNRLDVYGLGESGDVLQLWFNGRLWSWSRLGPMS